MHFGNLQNAAALAAAAAADAKIGKCEVWSHYDVANYRISIFLLVGSVFSYAPQLFRIIFFQSSYGLSPVTSFLSVVASVCLFLNIIILQNQLFGCLSKLTSKEIFASLLGILQMMAILIMTTVVLSTVLIYFPRQYRFVSDSDGDEPVSVPVARSKDKGWRQAICLGGFALFLGIVLSGIAIGLAAANQLKDVGRRYAEALGIIGSVLSTMQLTPQILYTLQRGAVGSLSVSTILIQIPGSALFIWSLRKRHNTNWSTWVPVAVAMTLQIMLLLVCLYVAFRDRQRREAERIKDDEEEQAERLLDEAVEALEAQTGAV